MTWNSRFPHSHPLRPCVPSARLPASVAVLPFANRSVDSEYEYFADGITEDVIALLTKIRSLKVISRTSVMTFNKSERNLREIGEKLGAATLPARNSVVASQAVMNIGEHGSFAESPVMSVLPVVGGEQNRPSVRSASGARTSWSGE